MLEDRFPLHLGRREAADHLHDQSPGRFEVGIFNSLRRTFVHAVLALKESPHAVNKTTCC